MTGRPGGSRGTEVILRFAASLAVMAASGRDVIADLEGLVYIDSSGLAVLARARQHARRAGCDPLLAAPQPATWSIS